MGASTVEDGGQTLAKARLILRLSEDIMALLSPRSDWSGGALFATASMLRVVAERLVGQAESVGQQRDAEVGGCADGR